MGHCRGACAPPCRMFGGGKGRGHGLAGRHGRATPWRRSVGGGWSEEEEGLVQGTASAGLAAARRRRPRHAPLLAPPCAAAAWSPRARRRPRARRAPPARSRGHVPARLATLPAARREERGGEGEPAAPPRSPWPRRLGRGRRGDAGGLRWDGQGPRRREARRRRGRGHTARRPPCRREARCRGWGHAAAPNPAAAARGSSTGGKHRPGRTPTREEDGRARVCCWCCLG